MTFDVAEFRSHFPSLESGIAYFDGPGGTQTPRSVAAAVAETLCGPLSNRGGAMVASERRADQTVTAFREAMADLLAADPRGIVYGRSATQLTYDFSRHLAKTWAAGDEIVLSTLDHDANIRPWVQAAALAGVTVRWWEFDVTTAELSVADLAPLLGPRTRLVAVTAASNLLGTMPPIAEIAVAVHQAGALLFVDGVHYAAHALVDLPRLGADFFVCSPYKFLGPHCAALAADPGLLESLQPDKLLPSTNQVPERFEFGTLPYELMAGVTAAVDFIAAIGPADLDRRARIIAASAQFEEYETCAPRHDRDPAASLGPGDGAQQRRPPYADAVLHHRSRSVLGRLSRARRRERAAARRVVLRSRTLPSARSDRSARSPGRSRALHQRP